jgi:hypothetical protein
MSIRRHYLLSKICSLFSKRARRYVRDYKIIARSSFFDRQYYQAKCHSSDPVDHYLRKGYIHGLNPSENFSTIAYIKEYPESLLEQINPLVHFERFGRYEGKRPWPTKQGVCGCMVLGEQVTHLALQSEVLGEQIAHLKSEYALQSEVLGEQIAHLKSEYALQSEALKRQPALPPCKLADDLISIIVASYNYRDFLKETLDSILAQTYSNWEALVVDDGSNDGSKDLILSYASKDKRIKYLEHDGHQNRGLAATVKLGVDQAQGELIAFCESDDYWHPLALELRHKHLCSHPEAAISHSGYELIGESSLFRRYENFRGIIRASMSRIHSSSDLKNLFRQGNMIATFSCVMARRKVLLPCNFEPPVPAYLDWWLWWQIVERGEQVIFFDMPLTYWRVHGESFYGKESPQVSAHNRDLLIRVANQTFVENISE